MTELLRNFRFRHYAVFYLITDVAVATFLLGRFGQHLQLSVGQILSSSITIVYM